MDETSDSPPPSGPPQPYDDATQEFSWLPPAGASQQDSRPPAAVPLRPTDDEADRHGSVATRTWQEAERELDDQDAASGRDTGVPDEPVSSPAAPWYRRPGLSFVVVLAAIAASALVVGMLILGRSSGQPDGIEPTRSTNGAFDTPSADAPTIEVNVPDVPVEEPTAQPTSESSDEQPAASATREVAQPPAVGDVSGRSFSLPSGTWLSGSSGPIAAPTSDTDIGALAKARAGQQMGIIGTWQQNQSGVDIFNAGNELAHWSGNVDIGVGGIDRGESWAKAKDGAYDDRWTKQLQALAKLWKDRGGNDLYFIRFAHEMDGDWYGHRVTKDNYLDFIASWKRYRGFQMDIFPQAKLTFCPNKESNFGDQPGLDWREFVPGYADGTVKQWVDAGCVDYYNQFSPVTDQKGFDASILERNKFGAPKGLEAHRQFWESQGLPMGIGEWMNNGDAAGDSAEYIRMFHDYVAAHAGSGPGQIPYEILYQVHDEKQPQFFLDKQPKAEAMYFSLKWGSADGKVPPVSSSDGTAVPKPSASAKVTPEPLVTRGTRDLATPVKLPFHMWAGPAELKDGDTTWVSDAAYAKGGQTNAQGSGRTIGGTTAQKVLQSERWGDFGYRIPVANGTYKLRIIEAEIQPGVTKAGGRVFDVAAEGTSVAKGYDIVKTAGTADKATAIEATVKVTDGALNITFKGTGVNAAKVTAIELSKAG